MDSPSDAAVYSDAAFDKQPLETRAPGMPDKVVFTTQRLPQGVNIALPTFVVTTMQVKP
jgi:hypothetical protein